MRQIQIADEVYDRAQQRAPEAGFETVNDYVTSVLSESVHETVETPNLDHLFTPERLAIIDNSLANVRAGERTYTMDEVTEHIAQTREDWQQ